MMRVMGFLAGVGLTVAILLSTLDSSRESRPDAQQVETPTPEALSAVVTAIAEQVDLVEAGDEPLQILQGEAEPATDDAGSRSAAVQSTGDDSEDKPSEVASVTVTQLDVKPAGIDAVTAVRPDHESKPLYDNPPSGTEGRQTPDVQAREQSDSQPQDGGDAGTYLFWSPFRSAWAAQGFAGRLTTATRVPVEVIHAGPGNYRVAFNYADEAQRLVRIERIETITGLQLE